MIKKLLLCIALLAPAFVRAQNYWQQEVNYTIDVSLNDVEHSITGFIKMRYINHSPDSLSFIWFHVWPNAYKSDRTAFSDQLLEKNRTDFYFSNQEDKGYINRLDFRVNGAIAKTEDHPQYTDIIKLILPHSLAPGDSINITTPFFEKLPFNFSRGGHVKQSYQLTQWYPKPAVYDRHGWHPIPYLDQGEFYSEFGNYDVRITVGKNYVVAATGELQDEDEKKWMISKGLNPLPPIQKSSPQKKYRSNNKKPANKITATAPSNQHEETKTLRYTQNQIHDFAWFADKSLIVKHDTAQLASGKIISVYSFYTPSETRIWANSVGFIKNAIRFYSSAVGEYPYSTMSLVEIKGGDAGGMEYPTIASISPMQSEKALDLVTFHETGHQWFYGALGSNERKYPWLDEGVTSYYEKKYQAKKYPNTNSGKGWLQNKFPDDWDKLSLSIIEKEKSDQPISTESEEFTETNYDLIAYDKASFWVKQLEDSLGPHLFDSCMHHYFETWKFKHPDTESLQSSFEAISNKKLNTQFELLNKKGSLTPVAKQKKIKPAFLFSFKNTDRFNYVNIGPAAGYNLYDKFMIGAIINNYNLPRNNFEFILAPLYSTQSKQLKGLGNISYSWHPDARFQKISVGVNGAAFSTNAATDTNNNRVYENFSKIVPYIRLIFKNKSAGSSLEKWIDFRTFIISEKKFDKYILSVADSNLHPTAAKISNRYLNQLTFNISNARILYPYNVQLQLQQSDAFYRLNLTGNYFFNYDNEGGMNVRFFAAKFGQWSNKNTTDLSRYEPKLLGVTGEEDYTYSSYFLGRTASYAVEGSSLKNSGLAAQQIMIRDGGLKLRIDQYDFLQGRSNNWVAALNFNSTLPNHLFPVKIPIRLFFDVGTYAEAWKINSLTSRFLYVGGFQLSLFENILNIYVPVIYSSDFSNQLKTIPTQNTFWKRITFSIDIQNFDTKKIMQKIISH
ncbi:MAG: M1 family metallopeptidase [Bacteroidetes bacterium]|nr:M1 family metallopeptidase [Bacteroidota bacterium]